MADEKPVFDNSAEIDPASIEGDGACRKRCRSSKKVLEDGQSPKRQRQNELITTGLINGDKKPIISNKPYTKDITELMMENQRLLLESKFRDEIHGLEKKTLKLVTELRTENRLFKLEISRLEKENNALRFRDCRVGLDKCEVNRRLKKFPWLPIHAQEEKTQVQSSQSSKANFEWQHLPTDVTFKILKYLQDEDLFVLRGISTQFYEAFYSQEDFVDCERCIWLAKRGRRFVNLKFIHAFDDFTWKEFRVLGPSNFPKLEVLWLENSSPRLMKSHPNLRELQFTAHDYDDLQWVTDKKFPALEVLIFSMEEDIFEENANRMVHLLGHKSLTHFGFDFCEPSLEEIKELTKAKFPQLRVVGISGEVAAVPEVLDYLSLQGFEFTDNIKQLSINQSNFHD